MRLRTIHNFSMNLAFRPERTLEEIGVAGARPHSLSEYETLPLQPMIIYGTTLLAICQLLGIVCGDLLGRALGMKTNVGGIGIAMLFLIAMRLWLHKHGRLSPTSEIGVSYWGAIYIPVVVAMAMQQNVVAALRGGPMALLAATGSVVACGCLTSVVNRSEKHDPKSPAQVKPTEVP
jgi:malonate transporter MadL subunit